MNRFSNLDPVLVVVGIVALVGALMVFGFGYLIIFG